MLDAHVYYGFNVVVVKGVEDRFACLAVFDDTGIFQYAKLMRDSRHAHIKLFGDVADAQFTLKEQVKYLYSRTVAHDREKLGKLEEMLVVGELYSVNYLVMRFVLVANGNLLSLIIHFMPPCCDS